MAAPESERSIPAETSLHKSLHSSISSRRRTAFTENATLLENNDEEERLALRREINISTAPTENASTSNKRRSLGLSFLAHMSAPEITDRISECIKLSTENKINTKNAFNLEMIDFMTYMIKKQDVNMSNLQVASTSLDVSTKIYGFRVDGIHMELMKMAGGADKQDNETPINAHQDDPDSIQENLINNLNKQKKKKQSRNKLKIICTVNSLKGSVEIMKPLSWMIEDGDSQTTDALNQVILPNHANSKFYLHPYNDVIVDKVEHEAQNMQCTKVSIPKIEDFCRFEICPTLANFNFNEWTYNNEATKDEEEENEKIRSQENNENEFRFDLDASVPSEDEANDVDEYLEPQQPVEKIVDLCKVVTNTVASKISEYSFIQKSNIIHWAGPSYWKANNLRRFLGTSKIVEECHQKPVRKRKELEISYSDELQEAIMAKFVQSKATSYKSQTALKTEEENITLPRDMHYNIASTVKLYLHELVTVNLESSDQLHETNVSDDIENYNYNNENDISNHCPNVPNDNYGANENNDNEVDFIFEDDEHGTHPVLAGDNLVAAPKLTNKISIAYSTRAKKVDMRQLKKSIWKGLISNDNRENINIQNAVQHETENKMNESKRFSEVYKILPATLTKTNIEALSFPISFVSLLHLANEKTLKVESLPDMSDIIITAD